jgi:hypothetical protein
MEDILKRTDNYKKEVQNQIRGYSQKGEYALGAWGAISSAFTTDLSEKIDDSFKINIFHNFDIELPIEFKDCEIVKEIQKSTKILKLKDDWDGEGSKSYKPSTLKTAILFIVRYATWIWEEKLYAIPTPKILAGPDGAIDIYWKREDFDLLITIPEGTKVAHFYGDDKKDEIIEGRFNIEKYNQGIFLSLLKLN